MNVSFPTLTVEEEEKSEGVYVRCFPNPEGEPDVSQMQHRVVCLMRPHAYCAFCKHRNFTLKFDANPESKSVCVACPRWQNAKSRLDGEAPEHYLPTKVSRCEEKPYEFCASCPSRKALEEIGLDKTKPGWYGRWHRFHKEEVDDGRDPDDV